jgi:hypothetical protein
MHAQESILGDVEVTRRGAESARDADGAQRASAGARDPAVLGTAGLLRLQREAGNGAVSELVEQRSPVLDVISSGGEALEPGVRADMEGRMGHDFGGVRVHTDDAASASAQSVGAHAYTVGNNVVFQRDAYDPSSQAGRTTLAHELTHVVQQRSGAVDGTPAGGGVSISEPGDRFERAAADNATQVMSAPAPVQREAEDEQGDEQVQGLFVQRQDAEEDQEDAAG